MFSTLFCAVVLALGAPAPGAADAGAAPDPQALLERADRALGRFGDAEFTIEVTVVHPDGASVARTMKVWQRGRDQRLVKFLAPARLRGTGLLLSYGERVFVYLPAYGRVREVTGREGGDAFLGTGFSVDELALVRLAPTHTATLAGETDEAWILRLSPRTPADHEHAALRLTLRKADDLATGIEYLDAAGEAYRVLELGDFRTVGGHPIAHRFTVRQPGEGRSTRAEVKEAALDRGLDASFFTERQLVRRP
jgi:hypothetical protein